MLKKLIPFIIIGLTAIITAIAIALAVIVSSPQGQLENALNSYTNYAVEYITDGIYAFSKDYSTQGTTGTQLVFHNENYTREYDFQAGYTPLGSYFSAVTPDFTGEIIRSGNDAYFFTTTLESYVSILPESRVEVDRDELKDEVKRIVKEKFTAVIKSTNIKKEENVFSINISKEQIAEFIISFKDSAIINQSLPNVINFGGLCDRLLNFAADIEYSVKISGGEITGHEIKSGDKSFMLSIYDRDIDVVFNDEMFFGKLVHWDKGAVPLPAIHPDEIKHDWSYENGFTW